MLMADTRPIEGVGETELLRGACWAGPLRAITQRGGKLAGQRDLGVKGNQVTAFGEGQDGELFVLSQGDGLQRIDPA